jgi:GNAT superfamily N-acetyltransferase
MDADVVDGAYSISTDPKRFQIAGIHAFLSTSYWSPGIPLETLEAAIRNSLSFGLFHDGVQVGFARVVTDRATFAYLCDVYVLPNHVGQGRAKWMLSTLLSHPDLQGLRRFLLATRDAHALYSRFGFRPLGNPSRFMEILQPNIYEGLKVD